MKRILPLVCLFLCFPMNISYEDEYNEFINQITDEVVLSKKLNELENSIQIDVLELEKNISLLEMKKEENEERVEYYFNKYNELSSSIPIYMKLDQLDMSDSILSLFNSYYDLYTRYNNLLQNIQYHIESKQSTTNEYNELLDTIHAKQSKIFEHHLSNEMKEEGEYNLDSMINGDKDLPVFGGYYTMNTDDLFACLASGNYSIDSYSDSWIFPISSGNISAGTWAYPNGQRHLGLDVACSMYSSIQAPANGIILYANAPVDSNCGYLENWVGWPAGGGNTICMICAVNGELYAVTFAHLSSSIYVVAGQQVRQGDVLALSGNSGNSSGPHCHIEVFKLKDSLENVVSYFIEGADFSFGNGFNRAATCSGYACRIRPESIWG